MIIVKIVILLVFLIGISKSLYNLFRDLRSHRKRMRNLDQWSKFHHQLIEWSNEIVDQNVKIDFINNCVHKLLKKSSDRLDMSSGVDVLDGFDVDKEKQKVFEKWGKHIPSLTQEIRESKLNKIL